MSKELGERGERLAADYLKSLGHEIVALNYRCPFGEVDIITLHEGIFHFHEVKTIAKSSFHPLEQITAKKLNRIIKTTQYYLKHYQLNDVEISIDAIGIVCIPDERPVYYYEENITL